MSFDVAAKIGDRLRGIEQRPATLARAQSGLLGLGGALEESYVRAQGMAGGTGRAAVDSRGDHPEEESAVEATVAGQNGVPALCFGKHIHSMRLLLFSYHPAIAA